MQVKIQTKMGKLGTFVRRNNSNW
uniref:Uncharacterized protein n=1 Tax=Rhizophora mucronata TaxID=61149 RepID=A0A2P2PFY6_RHIMU